MRDKSSSSRGFVGFCQGRTIKKARSRIQAQGFGCDDVLDRR
jgi:hypothetical protein